MALFVGRISQDTRAKDLEDIFHEYGTITRCDVKQGFAFVEFDDRRDADDALRGLDGTTLLGKKIAVEWARGNRRTERRGNDRDGKSNACFRCGEEGHWARDCREPARDRGGRDRGGRDRGRDRRRSPSPRDRGDSRSNSPRDRRRSPSPRDRRRSPSPRDRRRSPSPRDRRRSPSPRGKGSPSPRRDRRRSPSPRDRRRSPSPRDRRRSPSPKDKRRRGGSRERSGSPTADRSSASSPAANRDDGDRAEATDTTEAPAQD